MTVFTGKSVYDAAVCGLICILRKPKLFIFDESTANLDEITGNTVLRNVETYAEGIGAGIVYIAHNENVVKRCDEVIELENRIYQNRRTEPQKCIA